MRFENPTDEEIRNILKNKKRIAVVGLSDNPMKTSYMVSSVMRDAGYEIIPVNPAVDEVFGIKAVKTLQDIEGHVDVVNVFRRSEYLPQVAKDTVAIGADVFWAQLGLANDQAYDYLKEHNVISIMDKCIKVEYARLAR
ncbi:CoA-binding protein [Fictibacillus sp. S7]|uniref:CoA-binding protein n=1 Tax=Fictibacillus sp. S7 TaxID=2212476 RepID=UPI0010139DBC|nr:CoA-binding protein [Fictibacillus sp. S7]RXY98794.1 CoA-binding protein [Fictibacillus sp. S7]